MPLDRLSIITSVMKYKKQLTRFSAVLGAHPVFHLRERLDTVLMKCPLVGSTTLFLARMYIFISCAKTQKPVSVFGIKLARQISLHRRVQYPCKAIGITT